MSEHKTDETPGRYSTEYDALKDVAQEAARFVDCVNSDDNSDFHLDKLIQYVGVWRAVVLKNSANKEVDYILKNALSAKGIAERNS